MVLVRLVHSVAAVVLVAAAATGCTYEDPEPRATASTGTQGSEGAAPTPTPSPTPTMPTKLLASYPENEKLIVESSSHRGAAKLGPFTSKTGYIAVYVRCIGNSEIKIDISGVANFPQNCVNDPEDLGTKNSIDVRYADKFTITGEADASSIWAIAITEDPTGGVGQ
ncbi:hypothetical protein [Arthrobacter celericrescens]|uniref:hypothetical protein n=1 Tax=Arthrobacter celericrescens TaxID=2320851 RepID=UPI0013C510A7|nr:hypothetical protein [Arthrobacter celericrescens]